MPTTPEANTLHAFLELACLQYKGGDGRERWDRARAMLNEDPTLATATLHGAAATANLSAVTAHLDAGVSPAAPGGSAGWPPLLHLCNSRVQVEDADPVGVLDALLAAGADPSAHYIGWGSPFTAITGAIGEGEQGLERLPPHPHAQALVAGLLAAGASPNDCQALYNTMLRPNTHWLRVFLAHGLTAEHTITWIADGSVKALDFLLAHSASKGWLDRVELLLANGADPSCIDTYAQRPAHSSAMLNGHVVVAARLVQAGAVPAQLGDHERLRLALVNEHYDEVQAMLAANPQLLDNSEHLLWVISSGRLGPLRFLLDAGADANGADCSGVTALHKAASADDADAIALLLEHGADPLQTDTMYNATPLGWARHQQNPAAIAALLAAEGQA